MSNGAVNGTITATETEAELEVCPPSPEPSPPLRSIWWHLTLLLRSGSKESVEHVLQALWRTRRTGLDDSERELIRSQLSLPSDEHLDPLLVCLRILIRKCVYESVSKDEIQKLFPQEVAPELQRLLSLLLQKFQPEWQEDVKKEKASVPHLKGVTWTLENQGEETANQVAVLNLKLQADTQSVQQGTREETDLKFQLGKDALETILQSMYRIRDQMSTADNHPNGRRAQAEEEG